MNNITKLSLSVVTLFLIAGCGRTLPTEPEELRKQSTVANSIAAKQGKTNTETAQPVIDEPVAPVIRVNERRQGKVAETLAAQQWKVSPSPKAIMNGTDSFKFSADSNNTYVLQALHNQTWQTMTDCTVDNVSLSGNAGKAIKQMKKGFTLDCGHYGTTSLIGFTKSYNIAFTQ